jgi:hypothetical protein
VEGDSPHLHYKKPVACRVTGFFDHEIERKSISGKVSSTETVSVSEPDILTDKLDRPGHLENFDFRSP